MTQHARHPQRGSGVHMTLALAVKLGSIAVHTDEYLSPSGHPYDREAITGLLKDPEIVSWVEQFTKQGFLPVKRGK